LAQLYRFLGVDSSFQPADLFPRKPGNYDPADQAVRQSLVQYYEPHNEALFSLIGQRFDWQ